jgi:DUF4097 and DUF4098 domain-containing protein YvlB
MLRYSVMGAVVVAVMPRPAGAQVYPDRIVVKTHTVVAYQRGARDANREEQTERTTRTLKIGGDGSIDIENISGNVTVTRGGGSDATVEIVKTAQARDASDAKTALGLVNVDVIERAGRAEIRVRYPNGNDHRNINVSVNFTVTAPAGTRVSAQSVSGNLKITDIKGDLAAKTISGDVTINGAGRINEAKTISGNVEIADVKTDGGIDAGTVSGDVRLRRVSARRVGAGTVSGDIHLEDVDTQNVSAHSTSGSISFSGGLTEHGRYELKAFSGDVRLAISGKTGFEIDANSFSGDIRSDFPITTHGTGDTAGHGPRRTILRGTYGDGSAVVQVTSFNGSVVIAKR